MYYAVYRKSLKTGEEKMIGFFESKKAALEYMSKAESRTKHMTIEWSCRPYRF